MEVLKSKWFKKKLDTLYVPFGTAAIFLLWTLAVALFTYFQS